MIATVSRHAQLLALVRDYLSRHPSRRHRDEALAEDSQVTRQAILDDVHAYVLALEQVVAGDAVHRGRLLENRGRFDRAVRVLAGLRHDRDLADYEAAVRMYVHTLRVQLDGGGVSREVMHDMREFYEEKMSALEPER